MRNALAADAYNYRQPRLLWKLPNDGFSASGKPSGAVVACQLMTMNVGDQRRDPFHLPLCEF